MKTLVKPGINDFEIDQHIRRQLKLENIMDEYLPGPGKGIHISFNNEICHEIPKGRIVNTNDLVSIDISIPYKGVYGDAAWTYCLAEEDSHIRNFYIKARSFFVKLVNQLENHNELDSITDYIPELPLFLLPESSGHGIGIYLHMKPFFKWDRESLKNTKIPDNSFFTLEPIIGLKNSSKCIHFEMPFIKQEGKIKSLFEEKKII